ncbi:MAG: hypothetical protein LBT11_00745, partial [Treponema sp.]|nr:hypothetical protein [Treponema sp.]
DYAATVNGSKVEVRGTGSAGTELTVTVTNNGESATAKFTAVDAKFARPASTPVEYTVQEVKAGGIAQLKPAGDAKWYYVAEEKLLTNIDIIYRANKDLPAALALFHLVVAPEANKAKAWFNASPGDYIKLKGTAVPTGTNAASLVRINVGVPGENNAALLDVVIPPGELGATEDTSYTYTWIVVNNGAYLDVAATQTMGGEMTDSGKFKNGTVRVAAGGKVRDSAWMGWPLGSTSAFRVLWGGSIAVGKGDRDGHTWVDGYTAKMESSHDYYGSFEGWLIAPSSDTNATAVWGTKGSSSEEDGYGFLDAFDTNVVIYGNVTIKKTAGLIYDVLLVAGTTLTIDAAADLNPKALVYGQPASSGAMPGLGLTTALPASTIILNGTITETPDSGAFKTGGVGTYTITGTPSTTVLKPYTDQSIVFYTNWTKSGS